MRVVRIQQAAAEEAVEAAAWYELQRPGLGREFDAAFIEELSQLVASLADNALPYADRIEGVRRMFLTHEA